MHRFVISFAATDSFDFVMRCHHVCIGYQQSLSIVALLYFPYGIAFFVEKVGGNRHRHLDQYTTSVFL